MTNASLPTRSRENAQQWWIMPWLVVSQVATLVTLIGWYAAANGSLSAVSSSGGFWGTLFVILLWAYPLFPFLCILFSWVLVNRGLKQTAALISGLPLIPPAVFLFWSWVV